MIVLISGKQGSGKTTTSELVQEALNLRGVPVYRYRYSQPVYDGHNAVYAALKPYGIEMKGVKDGELLQLIGTEWGRQCLGEDVWVNAAKVRVAGFLEQLSKTHPKNIALIDDLRFINEFHAFEPGCLRVRLECPEEVRRQRVSYWRENDKHQSEIELDDYAAQGKFEMLFHTDKVAAAVVANAVVEEVLTRLTAEVLKELG